MTDADKSKGQRSPLFLSRRKFIALATALGATGVAFALRQKLKSRISAFTQHAGFAAAPPLVPHTERDRTKIYVSQGKHPSENVDVVIDKLGGIDKVVGEDDIVIIKMSAQWWNQGMTNVAAAKRLIERILERPSGFKGEIIAFENTHFRMKDGSGLSRAWVRSSERNVDVEGFTGLGDLIKHFRELKVPVSFVGLVDAGPHALSGDEWHDPKHELGVYGGDGRGPIQPGESRDGYHWDFERAFRLKKSWVDEARTPLTWPRFTSPHSGLVVDFKDGALRRDGDRLVPANKKVVWINMTTANEHSATGFTGACKSTMGIVDMSAGALGTHPLARGYASVHYFGQGRPSATWRMAGPLAHFAKEVRAPDLILLVAEWVAYAPEGHDHEKDDIRHAATSCANKKTIVAGTDPVAIDAWAVRNLMRDLPSKNQKAFFDLDDPEAKFTKFLRYYREVWGKGTLDPTFIEVA